ncbi:hypothetical protein MBLNU230_g5528t1 [Neophaeotheca triangularis]
MPSSNYTVASSRQLLGAQPPKRVPRPEDTYLVAQEKQSKTNTMRTTQSSPTQEQRQQKQHQRTVRFSPSTELGSEQSAPTTNITHSADEEESAVDSVLDSNSSQHSNRSHPPIAYLQNKHKCEILATQRSKELLAQRTLPSAHQWRIQQPLTTTANPQPELQVRTRPRTGSRPTDVYFSPLDANGSSTCLSEPLSPASLGARSMGEGQEGQTAVAGPEVLELSPMQVDRITIALAESKLLKESVARGWWDRFSPAVFGGEPGKQQRQLYSQPNKAISPQTQSLHLPTLPPPLHLGTAIADPKIHGAPILSHSQNYKYGANTVNIGTCTFLNLPYGSSSASNLRVEPPSPRNSTDKTKPGTCKITIQTASSILDRKTKKQVYLLVNEYDITASITSAAIAELQTHLGAKVEVQTRTPTTIHHNSSEEIDWAAMAASSQAEHALTDTVELAAASFTRLTTATCSLVTKTLLAQLEVLGKRQAKCLVLRASSLTEGPRRLPSRIKAPWASVGYCENEGAEGEGDGGRGLREAVAVAVGRRGVEKGGFGLEVGGRGVEVQPLVEGKGERERERDVVGWVCTL